MASLVDQIGSLIGRFNAFDWAIMLVWLVSCGYGLTRGFAREAFSLLGWIAAFFIANLVAQPVAELLSGAIDDSTSRYLLAWAATFIAVLLTIGAMGSFLSEQMRQPGFNLGNRLFGAVFGLLRGVIIIAGVSVVLRFWLPPDNQQWLETAVLMEPVQIVADWIGANFERVRDAEPTEAVKESIDVTDML
jgi:membrane protein required for colicin V production